MEIRVINTNKRMSRKQATNVRSIYNKENIDLTEMLLKSVLGDMATKHKAKY